MLAPLSCLQHSYFRHCPDYWTSFQVCSSTMVAPPIQSNRTHPVLVIRWLGDGSRLDLLGKHCDTHNIRSRPYNHYHGLCSNQHINPCLQKSAVFRWWVRPCL